MTSEIITAIIAFAGTMLGTFGGIITSSKLTNYRLQKLEEKVDKHNNFAERIPVIQEQINSLSHRVDDIEKVEKR